MSRGLRVAIGMSAVVMAGAIWPYVFAPIWGTTWERALSVAIFLAYVASGLFAWSRRPENPTGKILILVGLAFYLQMMSGLRVPVLWTLSMLYLAFIPLLFYALLAFPEGRLHNRTEKYLMIYMAVELAWVMTGAIFLNPAALGCPDCQAGLNLLLIHSDPVLLDRIQQINGLLVIGGFAALLAILSRRWLSATIPARRVLAPMLLPAAFWSLSMGAYFVFQQFARHSLYEAPEITYQSLVTTALVSMLVLPVTFLVGLSRYRARRAKVSELFVELGELPRPEHLRDALARTLGDPALEVGFWVSDANRYLTAEGRPVLLDSEASGKTVTYLERRGDPLAVILHDPALLDDPGLVDAVAAGARLAVENDRLQAEVRAQLEEVRASRVRIMEAADDERKKIERNLHDGAQARLLSLSLALQVVSAKLDEVADAEVRQSLTDIGEELRSALAELRELARGIHPAVLTNEGLGPALEVLADRAPVDVSVLESPGERLPGKVEAAGYFVVAEALANAARHANASEVTVKAISDGEYLAVEIKDNGVGGASMEHGSGLRGLADRVQALGGDLEVESPPGGGTSVRARIPCA